MKKSALKMRYLEMLKSKHLLVQNYYFQIHFTFMFVYQTQYKTVLDIHPLTRNLKLIIISGYINFVYVLPLSQFSEVCQFVIVFYLLRFSFTFTFAAQNNQLGYNS